MNLLQTIHAIEAVAAHQPTINSIVRNDVYRLNSIPDAKYGVFAWLQGEHRIDPESSLQYFAFTFFYIDRLTFNKANQVEVQSVGIETLENILRALAVADIVPDEHTFRTFNERFSDECAGVYCTLTLEVPKDGTCPEDFWKDFDRDFNFDYSIDDYITFK